MSYPSNTSCVTCAQRNKKCDGTRGPTGCRRCVQAGLKCERYLPSSSRIPKAKHRNRGNEPQASTMHSGYVEHTNTNEITDASVGLLVPQSAENCSADPANDAVPGPWQYTDTPSYVSAPHAQISNISGRIPTPPTGQFIAPSDQLLTPPIEGGTPWPLTDESMVIPRTNLTNSNFSQANDVVVLPLTPRSPGSQSQSRPIVEWPVYDLEDDSDTETPENLRGELLDVLVLDPQIESNTCSFIIHSLTSWMSRFLFEPTRAISLARYSIIRSHALGPATYHRMVLVADTILAVSKSTNYDLTPFLDLYADLLQNVIDARARSDLTRESAVEAMESSHEFITIMCKICSLASVLNIMGMYAPIFRRACPEPGTELVNLPRTLVTFEIHLKLYATLDILLSVITHRPMFFRYNLEISPRERDLLDAEDGPGLRWLYGVPDRLVVVLAKMNTLLEDFGSHVDQKTVKALEKEIEDCKLVVPLCTGDPVSNLGRVLVQQCWKMVASVYLYMALCGADSNDARVVKIQKTFMKIVGDVRPRRNPDSFLVVPMLVIGVATTSSVDQSALLARLWGVCECNRPGTLGNDIIRMLNDIWARTAERPAVWSDLRMACLRITGM